MVNLSSSRGPAHAAKAARRPSSASHLVLAASRRRQGLNSTGYSVAMVVTDYVVAWISLILALLLLSTFSRNSVNHLDHFYPNFKHGFWFPVGIVLAFALTGGYRLSRRSPTQSTFSDLKDYAMNCSFGAFLALTMSYVAHHFGNLSIQVPTQVIVAIIIATFLIAFSHATLRHFVLGRRPQRVAIVDDGTNYQRIATHLHLQHGVTLVGRIDAGEEPTEGSLGPIEQIDAIVARNELDRVIFGTLNAYTPATEHGYRRATEIVDTALVPRMFEVISWRSRLTELSGLPLLELAPRHVSPWDRAAKRGFDLVVATVALVLTAPVCLVIAALVKLTSHGPVFFRQERLGRDRGAFTILKFRTMRVEGNNDGPSASDAIVVEGERAPLYLARDKVSQSARLTPIGGFLRRSGLDEIPQFLNVLVGSMSVVGPRPFITSESEQHSEWSARRFEVAPGITGLWQVSGRNNLTEDELRQLDYLYVSAWSMWWDIKICFDTPRAMIRGLGAY